MTTIDPERLEAQARRVKELRAEAEYHQRRVDNFNAQADVIERAWGLAEAPATPAEESPAFESFKAHPPSVAVLPPYEAQ